MSEIGLPGFQRSTWHGLLAPSGLSKDIVTTLNGLVVKIVNTQDVRELFARQGLEARTSTPGEFAELIRSDIAQVTKLIRSTGAKTQ